MKVLIIEDEALAAKKLIKLLEECEEGIQIISHLSSVSQARRWFESENQPDLIFSDVQLSDGLSFEIFQDMPFVCPIIFTTAFDQYAIQAFEVNSMDYLLKPVKADRLKQSLEKYRLRKSAWQNESPQNQMDVLIRALQDQKNQYKSRFMVKLGNKIQTVKAEHIAYFHSDQKISFLTDREGRGYPVDNSLEELINMLDPESFFRVNRKYIVHIDAVAEIKPYVKGRLKLYLNPKVNEDVIVSSEKSNAFKAWLDQ